MLEISLLNQSAAKIKIEEPGEMKDSLFKHVYEDAAGSIRSIIDEKKEDSHKFYRNVDDYNHVIAFTGDRGAGKTSAMISFANALDKIRDVDFSDVEFLEDIAGKSICYKCLDMIEPTKFSEDESILEIVVATMYQSIYDKLKRAENDKRKNLLDKFSAVSKSIRVLYRSKKEIFEGDNIGTLDLLAKSTTIKNQFEELIDTYLEFVFKKNDAASYLVISIDDLDMNAKHCFKISEEIRKYFCCKRIIVLMAIKIHQFTQAVQQEFIKDNKILVDSKHFDDSTYNMAYKYVTKLIPLSRRHNLPELNADGLQQVKIKDSENESDFVDYFLKLIYQKTGLLLLKNDVQSHEIVPVNLREIQYFNNLLNGLNDVNLYAEGSEGVALPEPARGTLKHNLELFGEYITNNYISVDLPDNYVKILKELMRQDSLTINKFIIFALLGTDSNNANSMGITGVMSAIESQIDRDVLDKKRAVDVSMGDVLYALRSVLARRTTYAVKKLISGIKIIYSLRILNLWFVNGDYSTVRSIMGASLHNEKYIDLLPEGYGNNKNINDMKIYEAHKTNLIVNAFILHFAKADEKAFQYEANYRYVPTPGTVKNFSFNILCFITNLLDIELLKERNEVIDYNEKNSIAILPIWSMDFIDKFFLSFRRKFDLLRKNERGITGIDYMTAIIKTIERSFNDFFKDFIQGSLRESMLGDFKYFLELYSVDANSKDYTPKEEIGDFIAEVLDAVPVSDKTPEIEMKEIYGKIVDGISVSTEIREILLANEIITKEYTKGGAFSVDTRLGRFYARNLRSEDSIKDALKNAAANERFNELMSKLLNKNEFAKWNKVMGNG